MDVVKFEDDIILSMDEDYQRMVKTISNNYPMIAKATSNFNKSQSQFMDNMLTVSHPTELRNARQILAEINKIRIALEESYFGTKKKKIEIKKKLALLEISEGLNKELLEVEIEELKSQINTTLGYIEGAIRKASAYVNQYNNILKFLGKEEFSEEDFEKDEERYHIMKMFEQALCAARSHGGWIDEGNQIYSHQIGINGTTAKVEVTLYLDSENKLIVNKILPTHDMTIKWLKTMADKYEGSAKSYAIAKGMKLLDETSLHKSKEILK